VVQRRWPRTESEGSDDQQRASVGLQDLSRATMGWDAGVLWSRVGIGSGVVETSVEREREARERVSAVNQGWRVQRAGIQENSCRRTSWAAVADQLRRWCGGGRGVVTVRARCMGRGFIILVYAASGVGSTRTGPARKRRTLILRRKFTCLRLGTPDGAMRAGQACSVPHIELAPPCSSHVPGSRMAQGARTRHAVVTGGRQTWAPK
jgi:hypothetical protein